MRNFADLRTNWELVQAFVVMSFNLRLSLPHGHERAGSRQQDTGKGVWLDGKGPKHKYCLTMMNSRWTGLAKFSSVFLRLALGISFLSAVADRFGLWGDYGQSNVSWGNYARFVAYTAELNWYLPTALIPASALIATAAETLLGLLLVLGWKTRASAFLSGVLLTAFALTMTIALGVKAPLNFSVFSAAGGAFLLATCSKFPFSVDGLLRSR